MQADLINIIFGMKVRQARMAKGLSLTELARKAGMSASYVTEIEKGRKYPKVDKIYRMAQVLDAEYDDLVSIRLDPSLKHLEIALASPLLQAFPFEAFGVQVGDLVDLLTRAPTEASALIHALTGITRRFDVRDEHFLRAALRSYQEIHENYFPDIEKAAQAFVERHDLSLAPSLEQLKQILIDEFSFTLDESRLSRHPALHDYRSVLLDGGQPHLLLNGDLTTSQLRFLILREIGYCTLSLKTRAVTSPPDVVESFDQVFNDFRASYFAGAVLMPQRRILADIEAFFAQSTWQPRQWLAMLHKYETTPEMLLYRFSELVPQFFGIKLHFLRVNTSGSSYRLVKQLNMSGLPLPSGIGLNEHYCRRWLTVRLLREMVAIEDGTPLPWQEPHVGIQMSEFIDTREQFLCIGFGRRLSLSPTNKTSVIIGFRVDDDLLNTIRFAQDPTIPSVIINETCERCPLTAQQCKVRAAEPRIYQNQEAVRRRQAALRDLQIEMRE